MLKNVDYRLRNLLVDRLTIADWLHDWNGRRDHLPGFTAFGAVAPENYQGQLVVRLGGDLGAAGEPHEKDRRSFDANRW
ncbi:hypothetical protein [Bradyrhizobium sp. CCGUVB23]|uniref:hypothetical protein n=1 Tax=Bradyrhizobium sp. CCGUVB23 TaxID=2949630 RepID=UPI0020B20CD1|nr:hypothetical protein [Bradyrhizobium sp. CCGUVB23]MCP3468382.1 hypothetical protein [Bradyrhizobium sp. CCGUVB23]